MRDIYEFGVNTEKTRNGCIKLWNSILSANIALRFKGNEDVFRQI